MPRKNWGKRRKIQAIEWPTVFLVMTCYAAWAGAAVFFPTYPIIALVVLGVLLAMQSSLMHEAAHGHPTRWGWLNELLVGLPVGLVYPFRRFKALHLRHHADERLTDPFDDPESYYRALWHHEELPPALKAVLRFNNTMIGRFLIGPPLIGFVAEHWGIRVGVACVIPMLVVSLLLTGRLKGRPARTEYNHEAEVPGVI